tara:strand:- start:1877 stop:3322 length:1446 start_codon:yes stop_codon:yes gene_type:complete
MKFKQIKYLGLLGVALISLNSCNDIDLESTPYDSVAVVDGINNLSSATASVDGMYDLLTRVDYYGRELMVTPEVAADNILVSPSNSGRYLTQYQYSMLPTNGSVEDVWSNIYKNINAANTLLNFSSSATDATPSELNEINGHAYAIRGMAHFDLVKTYAFPYTTSDASAAVGANGAGGHLGVPLLIAYGQERHAPRSTVADVYTQVIEDLITAISLLPSTVSDSNSKYNKSAVQALLSRVYLYKEDYANAFIMANNVINSGDYSLPSNAAYMSNWDGFMESDVILQLPASIGDNIGFNALGSIYVDLGDDGNPGYGDLIPTTDITDLYIATDVRNNWFRLKTGVNFNYKFANSWTTTIPVIRLSEVYLTLAEAAANGGGSITAGQKALDKITQTADPSVTSTTSTGIALFNEVKVERRKELAFEGHRLYDILRWKENVVRTDISSPSTIATITYPDTRMVWPLPQTEVDSNDSINENNLGY